MKLCLTILNPTPEQLIVAATVCARMNSSRRQRNLYGTLHVLTFCSLGASVLAIAWKQSLLAAFSQDYLDRENQPEVLVSLIERALSRSLVFDAGGKLAEGEAAAVRSKADPDPTEDLLAHFPGAAKSSVNFGGGEPGSGQVAAWREVRELLTAAGSSGSRAPASWLSEVPNLASAGLLSLSSFVPKIAFVMDGTGESYLLMKLRQDVAQEVFPEDHMADRGCYRLFKLNGLVVSEVPILWVSFCTCGHVMDFASADGTFEFEFHKEKHPAHGFRLGDTPRRFSIALGAVTEAKAA